MPYDGNGNFVRVHNWTADASNALDISASEMDAEDNGFASGLSNAVTRDGQGKMTVDFLPNTDNVLNLGSGAKRWASINGVPVPPANVPWNFYPLIPAEATAGVTPTNFFYPPGDIRRYGGVGDGTTNNYSAFQKAVSVCQLIGLTLIVPAGNFVIDTTAATLNLSYVTIQGTGVSDGSATPAAAGSVISITGTAHSPFTIGPGVSFVGIGFYYPAQVDSATPIVFPPTIITSLAIAGAINFVYIQDCTVFNAYRFFVDTDSTGAIGHVWIKDCTIYGILTCIELAYNAEIITIIGNEFTFGHFLAATEGGLRGYTRANGTVAVITRTDGVGFTNNVLFGYLIGLHFSTSATLCQLTNIVANNFDQCLTGILADGTGNISLFSITGNSFNALNSQDHTKIGNCIKIATSGATSQENITVADNTFSLCTGDIVLVSGNTPNRTLMFSGNVFTAWGVFQAAGTYSCMNISGSSTSFQANGNQLIAQSGAGANQSGITCSCSLAVISGNIFGLCFKPLDVSSGGAVVTGNESFSTGSTGSNNYAFVSNTWDLGNKWDKDTLITTGWGTPVGGAVVLNYNITDAGGANSNTNKVVAEILTILKAKGIIGA